jgi:hypothetical protein
MFQSMDWNIVPISFQTPNTYLTGIIKGIHYRKGFENQKYHTRERRTDGWTGRITLESPVESNPHPHTN